MTNKYKEILGNHLKNKKIMIVVNADFNSYKAPDFIKEIRKYSADVIPYITEEALRYVTKDAVEIASGNKLVNNIDENKKFDAIIIYSSDKKINDLNLMNLNDTKIIKVDAKMDITIEVSNVIRNLSDSNLKGISVLVTAGPTPVKIDNVRRITNKFSGKLGIEIAKELYLRGANVTLFQSYNGIRPPQYIDHLLFDDYEEYKQLCVSNCHKFQYGIFSAAVADYKPKNVVVGKIPSGGVFKNIELIQTEKVINLVREENPDLKMISFKYEEGKNLNQLLDIANKRLNQGHIRVVANDLSLNTDKQKCFLCGLNEDKVTTIFDQAEGKPNIAIMIANDMEKINRK
jgi:phosphopantothenoylcysteine decarboxylase / phosphopantothenate---cysteine ligase